MKRLLLASTIILASLYPASSHDAAHPELNSWMMALTNHRNGSCCDGSDALHLRDVDWTTQNQESSHFKVRVPATAEGFSQASEGKEVETIWVDVDDGSVVDVPNKDGSTLVWPVYGYNGVSIRCFLPGTMG